MGVLKTEKSAWRRYSRLSIFVGRDANTVVRAHASMIEALDAISSDKDPQEQIDELGRCLARRKEQSESVHNG